MISGVGSIAVLVNDAGKSAKWYQDKLGFEIVENDGHLVFVRPKGTRVPLLHLCGKCDDWETDEPGGRTGIWLASGKVRMRKDKSGRIVPSSDPDEVEKTCKELKRKGVEFSQELTTTSWGKMAHPEGPGRQRVRDFLGHRALGGVSLLFGLGQDGVGLGFGLGEYHRCALWRQFSGFDRDG